MSFIRDDDDPRFVAGIIFALIVLCGLIAAAR